jgi:hypothetical protein
VARDAAIFLVFLREPEGRELMKSPVGRSIARVCAKIVHQSEWADAVWPENLSSKDADDLRDGKKILKGSQWDYWSE